MNKLQKIENIGTGNCFDVHRIGRGHVMHGLELIADYEPNHHVTQYKPTYCLAL
jgi:hypothetical protein